MINLISDVYIYIYCNCTLKQVGLGAILSRLEAIAMRLEATAIRLEAIASNLKLAYIL